MKVAHLLTCPTCRAEGKQNRLFGEFGQEAVACDAGHQFAWQNGVLLPAKAPGKLLERFLGDPLAQKPAQAPALAQEPPNKAQELWMHPEPTQTWKGDIASLVESSVPIGTDKEVVGYWLKTPQVVRSGEEPKWEPITETSTTGSTTFVPAPELDTRRLPEPRIIPGGDVLHTCRIPEAHASSIRAEAEFQGMTFSQYFQSRLEWLLDSGWMGSPVAPPKK